MRWFVEYDITGKIMGRVFFSEGAQVANYPRPLLEITRRQYDSKPEVWSTGVDLINKKLKGTDPTEGTQ